MYKKIELELQTKLTSLLGYKYKFYGLTRATILTSKSRTYVENIDDELDFHIHSILDTKI